jgi:hypothetical protein
MSPVFQGRFDPMRLFHILFISLVTLAFSFPLGYALGGWQGALEVVAFCVFALVIAGVLGVHILRQREKAP